MIDPTKKLTKSESLKALEVVAISIWNQQAGIPGNKVERFADDWRFASMTDFAEAVHKIQSENSNLRVNALLTDGFANLAGIGVETAAKQTADIIIAGLEWTRSISVPNFREDNLLNIAPSELEEAYEGSWGNLGEPAIISEAAKLKTYARFFRIDRRSYESDETGLFVRLGQQLGIAAACKLADLVYEPLLTNPPLADGQPWLAPEFGNQAQPGQNYETPLNEENLNLALAGLRTQKLNGLRLNLAARYLLIGEDEEVTARRLVRDLFDATELSIVVETRLTGRGFFLIADPATAPCVARLSLFGSEKLVNVTTRRPINMDGLEIRAVADLGAAPMSRTGIFWTPRQ